MPDNPLLNRYAVRGEVHLGSGQWHFIDSWRDKDAAIDTAKAVYGYDRVTVLDVANKNKIIWDSRA